ncbi:MAG TPA: M18 family aminopeptidase [Desulfobulbus sp.]|nr:M18 family aminopeptidase [Desulfobulbus sp.]
MSIQTKKIDQLLDFISRSPTPWHATSQLVGLLRKNGFSQLRIEDDWTRPGPGKYYVISHHCALAAFTISKAPLAVSGLRLAGAHTDSPCLKLKPNPVSRKNNMVQLGVEVYGGALLSTWFDRDLSLAGRLTWKDNNGSLHSGLVDFQRSIAIIPSLAIHLDREANSQKTINKQTDIVPLLSASEDEVDFTDLLRQQITQEHPNAVVREIIGHDLFFHDTQAPSRIGLHGDFLTGARMDNLLSCFTLIDTLVHAPVHRNSLVVLNPHEEVGSVSAVGAQGPFLTMLLNRLQPDGVKRQQMLARSLLISVDNAHGAHPNFMEKYDQQHLPLLNKGPVIKWNANQRYATDAVTGGFFRALCRRAGTDAQDFVMRNDMACGSTIGPLTAAATGIKTVDVGVPSLAMHSIRETVGSKDFLSMTDVMQLFFSLDARDALWQGQQQ